MRTFRHRRGRILFEIFGAFLIASVGVARWEDVGSIRGVIVAVAAGSYALYRCVMLLAKNPALAFGSSGIQVGRLLKVCDYRWDQVRDIQETVWKRPHIPFISFLHFLPNERHYIELQVHAAGLESASVKMRADMMELPAGGVKQVIQSFRAAQVEALGERGAASARLGVKPSGQSAPTMSAAQSERLQRLGIGVSDDQQAAAEVPAPVAMPQPNVPPRPVFGRKVG